jgi:hypothetical protein
MIGNEIGQELATAAFVKGQGYLTTATADDSFLLLTGGTMKTPGHITGFTGSNLTFDNHIGKTATFTGLVKATTTIDGTDMVRLAGVSKGIRFRTTTGASYIEGVNQLWNTYAPFAIGGSEILLTLNNIEEGRLTTTGLGIGGLPTQKLDIIDNVNGVLTARLYNASVGTLARSTLQLNSGGRYANISADYEGAFLFVTGSTSGLNSSYFDFNSQFWRTNAGVAQMTLGAGVLTVYGPGGSGHGIIQHDNTHLYVKAIGATGNVYLGGNNQNEVAVTGTSMIPVTTASTTLGDATHYWGASYVASVLATGYLKGGSLEIETAADAKVIWNSTANAANQRTWYARQTIANALRLVAMTDALAENTGTAFDFRADGYVLTYAAQASTMTGRYLANMDYVNARANNFLPLTGGTISGVPGTLAVEKNVTLAYGTVGGPYTVTIPVTPPTSNSFTIPATPGWVRDLLLNRAGAIANYQYANVPARLPNGDSADPKNGKITVEDIGVENGYVKKRIAMSTKDYDGKQRYLMALLPGDSLVGTDSPGTPVTGFTRYMVYTKPKQIAGSPLLVGEPGYPGVNDPYVYFDAFRIELAGTQPVAGNVITITGYLNSATGDGPVTGVNAQVPNLAGGGNSGVVTIALSENLNITKILADPANILTGQVALDAVDLGPGNAALAGGRMRWRSGPTSVSAKDFLTDINDNDFRFFTYNKGTTASGIVFGHIDLTSGTFNWYRGINIRQDVVGEAPLLVGNTTNTKWWGVIPDSATNTADVGYLISIPSSPTWGTVRHQGVAAFQSNVSILGTLGIGTAATSNALDIRDDVNAPLVTYLYNANTGASSTTQVTRTTGASTLHSILTQTSLREYASAAVAVAYRDFSLHAFRDAAGGNGIDIDGRLIKLYGATSGHSFLQASAVAGATTLTLPATSGTLALAGVYLPVAGGNVTGQVTITVADNALSLLLRGTTTTGAATRFTSGTRANIEAVDHGGVTSYKPMTIRSGSDLQLYCDGITATMSAVGFVTNTTLTANGSVVTDGGYMHVNRGPDAAGSNAYLYLDSAATQTVTGANSAIWFRTGAEARWFVGKGGTLEGTTSTNVGSDFHINAYNDAGVSLGAAITITRATRIVAFAVSPTAPTPATSDNDTSVATTAYVKAQGYATTATLAAYAPIASPTFTGTPKSVTPATNDNDTSIATTAYVKAQGYAPLSSPLFTGDARAVTPATSDNDTSIATTAFVKAQGYATAASMPAPKVLVCYGYGGNHGTGPEVIPFYANSGDSTFFSGNQFYPPSGKQFLMTVTVTFQAVGAPNNNGAVLMISRAVSGATCSQTACQTYNGGYFTLTTSFAGTGDGQGFWARFQFDRQGGGTYATIFNGVWSTMSILYFM